MPVGGGVVADTVAGEIVLPSAGDWMVLWNVSFQGSANTSFEVCVFGNGVRADGTTSARELGSGSGAGVGNMAGTSIVNAPTSGVAIDLRVRHGEGTNRDFTIERMQFWAHDITDLSDRTPAQARTAIRNKLGS